jgi:predicted HTH transcriptional regulator
MGIHVADAPALVKNLCALPAETDWVEFKVATFNADTIGKYVSALANAAMFHDKDHAYMVFGVEDGTHNIVGTDVRIDKRKVGNDNFIFWLSQLVEPKIGVQHLRFEIGSKWVELLCIDPAYQRPVTFKSVPYIRIGSAQQPLAKYPHIQQKIWATTSRHAFENTTLETNATRARVLSGFYYEQLLKLMGRRFENEGAAISILESYGFVESNLQDRYHIKALYPMMAAKDVDDFPLLKHRAPRVIHFKGTNKLNATSDTEGSRGYAVGFEAVLKFILEKLPQSEVIAGGLRKTVYKIPELAIREFLANAFIHQDFTVNGRPTVEIYKDKVRIINPGEPLIPTDRFINANSKSRNASFARLMREAGICEERARGVDLAISEIEKASLPPPLIMAAEESTTITIFMQKPYRDWSAEDRKRACYQHACLKYEDGEPMSNASLRERLGLASTQHPQVSNLISDSIESGLIRPLNDGQANRVARYIPYWA